MPATGRVEGGLHLHRLERDQPLAGARRRRPRRRRPARRSPTAAPRRAWRLRTVAEPSTPRRSTPRRARPPSGPARAVGRTRRPRAQASALGRERGGLLAPKAAIDVRLARQERLVLGEPERPVLDHRLEPAGRQVRAELQQLLGLHRVPADPIEEAQQPRRVLARTAAVPPVAAPHLHGASDELVAARALHPVDAQVGAADADGVLRRPGARRVVLRRHQPVAGVERGGDRRAEVDVAEPEHQIVGVEDDARTSSTDVEPVDPADELDVPRAPRRVGADAGHVALDRQPGRRVVPRERQMHDAAGHCSSWVAGSSASSAASRSSSAARRGSRSGSKWIWSERMPGVRSIDPGAALGGDPLGQRVHAHPQPEVERHRPVLDEQVVVAGPAVGDGRAVGGRLQAPENAVVARRARSSPAGRAAVSAAARRTNRDEPVSPGRSWPSFQRSPAGPWPGRRSHRGSARRGRAGSAGRRCSRRRRPSTACRGCSMGAGRPRRRRASPLRARPDQAHPGAGRVEVDLPRRRVELVDVRCGEELGRGVRALEHPSDPLGQLRPQIVRALAGDDRESATPGTQHVPGAQGPATVTAEAAERERRRDSQVVGDARGRRPAGRRSAAPVRPTSPTSRTPPAGM